MASDLTQMVGTATAALLPWRPNTANVFSVYAFSPELLKPQW